MMPTAVETQDSNAAMPYPPAVRVEAGCTLLFVSGATAMPLYHEHPHIPEEEALVPNDIEEQTHLVMNSLKESLDAQGATWENVVSMTRYHTDMREMPVVGRIVREYLGDWRPASTTICVNNLSSPGARLEIDMVVAIPPQ